jgi:hypothetical protein
MSRDVGRCRLVSHLRVSAPPVEAFELFTPIGEQAWAEGWAPIFPAGGPADPVPGLVFETVAPGGTTTWVVVDVDPGKLIRYARSRPGMTAGTVEVALLPDAGATSATVTYDLTALSDIGRDWLREFASDYEAEIAGWEAAIAAR